MLIPWATRPAATNWAEPAKTNREKPMTAAGDRPLVTPTAPNTVPKGAAPSSSGMVSFSPAAISRSLGCAGWEGFSMAGSIPISRDFVSGPGHCRGVRSIPDGLQPASTRRREASFRLS